MKPSRIGLLGLFGLALTAWAVWGTPRPAAPVLQSQRGTDRVIVYPEPGDTIAQVQAAGVTAVGNFGAYWLLAATPAQVAALRRSLQGRVELVNHFNEIEVGDAVLDVTKGVPPVPTKWQERNAEARRLRIVQFAGPVLPAWIKQLQAIPGVRVISYVPNNAYLVALPTQAESQLQGLISSNRFAQWIGVYQPFYKVPQILRSTTGVTPIGITVLDDESTTATLGTLQRYALTSLRRHKITGNQWLVTGQVNGDDLPSIAQLPSVLAVQPVYSTQSRDEVQGLVLAGFTNNAGGPVAGDSYVNYLSVVLGFPTDASQYPTLDICDTGVDESISPDQGGCVVSPLDRWSPVFYSQPNTPLVVGDLCCPLTTASRMIYNLAGSDADGHGTRVASVAVGYDNRPDEQTWCFTDHTEVVGDCAVLCVTNCIIDTNSVTVAPSEFYLSRRDNRAGAAFQLGLGVSPFGSFGVSPMPDLTNVYATAWNAYQRLARISNNSWTEGLIVGGNDGAYENWCVAYDTATRDVLGTGTTNTPGHLPMNQEMLFVFAAGNDNGVASVGGYGDVLITPPATAKNVLTVGASVLGHTMGRYTGAVTNIAAQSSFGPTRDGRIKPDVVAPGEGVAAAISQASYTHRSCAGCDPNTPVPPPCGNGPHVPAIITNPVPTLTEIFNFEETAGAYWTSFPYVSDSQPRAVTSYAAAAVSGGVQLLWWWLQNKPLDNGHPLLAPSPALLKGYIMNSARYLPIVNQFTGTADKLPSIAQGMGMLDLPRMFDLVPRVLRDETTPRAIEETMYYNGINYSNVVAQQTFFSQSGQTYELTGVVAVATAPFRVTLAWTDAPGSSSARKALVNDLDLSVTINGVTYAGNDFATEYSTVDPNPQYDHLNNVESVFLPASSIAVGMPWKIVVRATNLAGSGVPNVISPASQDFALVVYNADSTKTSDLPPATPTVTNNTCQGAASITNFPYSFTNQLTNATYANVHPSPAAGRGGIDEFFKIAHPSPGTTFSVNTFGSGFDTVLSVWHGTCGALVEDVSNNDSSNSFQSAVSFIADGASDYYIIAEPHNNGPGGTLVLNVQASGSLVVLEPSSLIFPDTISGTTSTPQNVTIHNGLAVPLEVLSANLLGSNATEFVVLSENCSGAQLGTNGTCTIQIAFAPTSAVAVARSAQLNVTDNATGSPRSVPLAGNVLPPAPVICLTPPNRLVFTNQALLTASSQDVVVQNCGTADLILSNAWIRSDAFDFVLTGTTCGAFPMTNSPGASCSLHIQFTPHTAGPTNAVLSITNNDGVAELTLLGTGCAAISMTPTNLPVPTAGVAYNQSLTASNGIAPYTFAVTAGALPGGLTLSSSGTISGTATNLASYTYQITATDAYGCRSTPQQYAGTISCPGLTVQPATLPDGLQGVAYTNAVNVIGGIAPFTFTMSSGSFPGVTLNPTNGVLAGTPAVVGPASFTVAVTDANGCTGAGVYTVNISPTAPTISFDPPLLPTFGDVVLGTTSSVQSVTIANSGTAPLVISGAILTNGDVGEFLVVSNSCGTIPVGGTCAIGVRFTPVSSGNKGASVMVFDNASGSPHAFTVKGRGIAPVIEPVPGSVDFGTNNVVGQWSAPQWVQVYNLGDGMLTITNVSLISTNAPDFTNLVNGCSQILPGDSCSLAIAFRARATGLVETATLVIDSTATNGEQRLPLSGSAQAVAPALVVSPVSLLFSNSTVGQVSGGQMVTVSNAGTAALVITNLSFSGGGTDQFVVLSATCVGASIAPNNSCAIQVGYAPTATGVTNSNLRILSNAGNGTNLVPVLGFGVAPVVALSPTSVGFGNQAVGTPSAAQLVLISNTGDAPFTLSGLSITGTNGGDFAAVPAGCAAVPPGGDCLVSVTFTPGSLGARTGTLVLNGNATNAPIQVPLNGTGATNATSISLAPQNLSFGNVSVGTTSLVQSVTVANNGNAALIITNIDLSVSGEFVLATAGCLNTPLAPGASCTVNLTFVPTHSGATNTLIRLWNNSGVNPASVPVSGVGAAPLISPHPAAVAFGNQPISITSTAQIIQVQNTGLAPLTLSSVTVSGTTDFVASPIGCTAVPPGGSCSVSVVYTPSTLGATNATLVLVGNADNSPVNVPLIGTGVPSAPVLLFNPTLLPTFGNVSIGLTSGVQSVTVTNAGTAALIISNVTLAGNNPGDFILDPPNTCVGVSVLPGGTCTISVKFTPTVSGNRGADVVVTNNAGIPQSFPVKGAGIAPSILVNPTIIDFGTQTVAVATAPQWVVAKNTGDGPLTITGLKFISTNAPDFSLVENNCLGSPIQPGDTCLLGINFTPGAALPRTGTLLIESTATNGEQRVHLSGVGTAVTNGPAIDWSPLNLSFGNQGVGTTSVVQSVTVTNHNTAPLIITNVDLSVAGEFLVSPVGCLNLPLVPGEICTLNVTFSPTNSGVHTSFIRIWNNATVAPAQIPIAGVGTAPLISLQPTVLAFGNQPVGVTSTSQTIQVQNTGTATLSISSVTAIGGNASDFLASPAGCAVVPPGASCSVSVVFNAGAVGPRATTLVLTGNADNSPVTVPLSGNGVPAVPAIGFSPALLPTFGDVVVGTTSTVQSVTVTNSGNAALVISSVVLSGNNPGDFILDPLTSCLGVAVQPGGICTINVKFTPTASGNRGAQVVVTDNAGGSPQSFPVKGSGIAPVILASPSNINFGTQQVSVASAPQWVQVYNTGNGPMTITGLTLISTNAPDFTILTNSCLGSPIQPGASCSIGLTFTPGAALPRTGTLVIDNTGLNGQQRIHLNGVGTNTAPALGLSPLSLIFGDTTLGTTSAVQSVTVTNGGTAPLVISGLNFTGGNSSEFVVLGTTCTGASILPGGTCTIQVGFAPTTSAVRVSNLQLLSNAGSGTNLLAVSGTGIGPVLALSTTLLDFGTNIVGFTSARQSIIVSNVGNAALSLTSFVLGGLNPGDFTIQTNACLGNLILPGKTCHVDITFTTATALLDRTATLTLAGNSVNLPPVVTLRGVGRECGGATLSLSPTNLPTAFARVNYPTRLTATGGYAPYSFEITAGRLPAGLSLLPSGVFDGKPTELGVFTNIVVTATDFNGCRGVQTYSLTVSCTNLTVLAPTLANTIVGLSNNWSVIVLRAGLPVTGLDAFPNAGPVSAVVSRPGSVQSDTAVEGIIGQLTNVSVSVFIAHPNSPTLTLTLIAPDGTAVKLAQNNYFNFSPTLNFGLGCSPDSNRTTFDDVSTIPIGDYRVAQPPYLGTFHPVDSLLDNLQGKSGAEVNGVWHLQIDDALGNFITDGGELNCWTLNLWSSQFTFSSTGSLPAGMTLNGDGSISGTPTAPGTNTFTIFANDGSGCIGSNTFTVIVGPAAPVLGFSPALLPTFGDVVVGTTSAVQSVTLTNAGTAPLVISSLAIGGNNPGDFVLSPASSCVGGSIPPGGTCQINVKFVPTTSGNRGAMVVVNDNSSGAPHAFPVKGAGIAPVILTIPTSINFGTQTVNVVSAPQWIQIYNTGNGPLTITGLTLISTNAPDFSIVVATNDTSLANPIQPGASASIGVTFKPGATLPRTATLVIDTTATNGQQRVALRGVGANAAPSLGLDPTSVLFGDGIVGTTGTVSITTVGTNGVDSVVVYRQGLSVIITNNGTAPLVISSIGLSGGDTNDFVVFTNNCLGASLAPSNTCTVQIGFAPTAHGVRSSNLQVLSNAGNGTNTVPVAGTGLIQSYSVTPVNLVFGSQPQGVASAPQFVLVQNTGEAPLDLSGSSVSGTNATDFAGSLSSCLHPVVGGGCLLYTGESDLIAVAFTPHALGVRSANLDLTTERWSGNVLTAAVIQTVTVSGTGAATAPSLGYTPANLNFADQTVGTTSLVATLTFTNGGNAELVVTNVDVVGADFSVTTFSSGVFLPGASGTVNVWFKPGTPGLKTGLVRIWNNSSVNPSSVPVSGTGIAPAISVLPGSVTFGPQTVGIPSAAQLVFVQNTGNAPLTLTSVSVIGSNGSDFAATPAGCAAVPPGGQCLVSVTFTPGALGPRTGILVINGNATNSPVQVLLSGSGVVTAPSIGLTPVSLGFGNQPVGSQSPGQTVIITNSGSSALVITNIDLAVTGQFSVSSLGCLNVPLAPGAGCKLTVTFAPTNSGPKSSIVRIWNNTSVNPASVPVTGVGTAPVISPVPAVVSFGSQPVGVTSAGQVVVVQNIGNAPLTLSSVTVVGGAASNFVAAPLGCVDIPVGGSCQISVAFTPSALGAATATMHLVGNADAPVDVPLSGTGVTAAPSIGFIPALLPAFGDVVVGTTSSVQSVIVTNPGTAALLISQLSLGGDNPGDFILAPASSCVGIAVLPGATCSINVKFAPTASGNRGANIVVTDNAGSGTNLIPIAGTGVAPVMALSTSSLDFGTNMVGVASAAQNITITNSGNAALAINSVTVGGLNPGDFKILSDPCLGSAILPGKTCKISVSFMTAAVLPRSAVLTIGSPAFTLPQSVTMTGVGTPFVCTPISLAPTNLPAAQPGLAYAATLIASGGTAPYQYAVTRGSLPAGLALDAVTGDFSGSPIYLGTFRFTVTATDANGCTGSCAYTLLSLVNAHTPPVITTASELADGIVGTPYSQDLAATGGTPPYSWTAAVNSALPQGLSLNGSTISGTPQGNGQFEFLITCAGNDGLTAQRVFFVTIKPLVATPVITPTGGTFTNSIKVTLVTATAGATLRYTLDGSDPTASSPIYKKAGIILTNSLTLKARAYKLNMADSGVASAAVTIISPPAPVVATASLADATAAHLYAATLQVVPTTGVPAYKWSWAPAAGSRLPAGLTLNTTRGTISGKPTLAGTYTFTVKVTDVRKKTGTQILTLTVN